MQTSANANREGRVVMTLTIKQENFAQAYVETSNQSEAYRRAYNAENMKAETVHKRASELMQNGDVAGRIAELKQEHAQRHAVTIDMIRDMLLEDREFAKEMESASSAVTATATLAKLYGLLSEKRELDMKGGGVQVIIQKLGDD